MSNSILSIAIPTYNRSDILVSNLQSILDELIEHQIPVYISDDSNNKDTKIAIQELQTAHSLISYFKNEPSLGHDKNCIRTLSIPKEKYIWYLGDSMILNKGTIGKILKIVADNDFDFVSVNAEGRRLDKESRVYTDALVAFSDIGWHLTMSGATIYRRTTLDLEKIDVSECINFPQLAIIFKNFDKKRLYWISEKLVSSNPNKKSYWSSRVLDVFVTDYYKTLNYIFDDKSNISHLVYQHARNSGLLSVFSLLGLVANKNINSDSYTKYNSLFMHFNMTEKVLVKIFVNAPKDVIRILYNFLIK